MVKASPNLKHLFSIFDDFEAIMRFILIILLFLIFGYSLGLVIANSDEVAVNLLFSQAPAMSLGLLLILCIVLGVLIGLLLSLLLFKVLQNKWEINRLYKDNKRLQTKLNQKTIELEKELQKQQIAVQPQEGNAVDATLKTEVTDSTTNTQ